MQQVQLLNAFSMQDNVIELKKRTKTQQNSWTKDFCLRFLWLWRFLWHTGTTKHCILGLQHRALDWEGIWGPKCAVSGSALPSPGLKVTYLTLTRPVFWVFRWLWCTDGWVSVVGMWIACLKVCKGGQQVGGRLVTLVGVCQWAFVEGFSMDGHVLVHLFTKTDWFILLG